jgi:hypothetical protein
MVTEFETIADIDITVSVIFVFTVNWSVNWAAILGKTERRSELLVCGVSLGNNIFGIIIIIDSSDIISVFVCDAW